jgi:acetyl esterase/lipase
MSKRNFSFQEYWRKRAMEWTPVLAFKGQTKQEWEVWHKKAYSKYMELLGRFPEKVDPEVEVDYSIEDGDLIRERVVFDTEEYMSVACQVLRPKNMKADKSNAAILCSHGHGPFGKDPVTGIRSSEKHEKDIEAHNYNYAEQMARAGFLTITPDLRGFGERRDVPYPEEPEYECLECNQNYVKGSILGWYPLTLNIWDMKCCIDYLETRPEVDPERIGMMGLSQGGTITTFTSAADPRIKAADIIGYLNPWYDFGIEIVNSCGSQVIPNIYTYLDTDEIAGLISPRPLLIESGTHDNIFYIQDALRSHEGVKEIYKSAGVEDRLWFDIFPGSHAFGGKRAFEFFKKYL